ncbi:hypothetical protein CSC17_5544 [Klebsiella oxytoca]|nr:hypothetical protein CSC17_5544 [Klebsiella oxytoca]
MHGTSRFLRLYALSQPYEPGKGVVAMSLPASIRLMQTITQDPVRKRVSLAKERGCQYKSMLTTKRG